ncbi:MAG: hypothetical protein LBI33_07935 [Propionibacteriaceae bacterium]|jgi:hypothetical protein|nr:hypothetical protein [Propionibacteriaceae bacterium]
MPSLAATVPTPRAVVVSRLRAQVEALETRGRGPVRPVDPLLAPLLPDGGLKPGAAYCLTSAALLAALLAAPSRDGLWCGIVGLPDFGTEAAALAGVTLERLALVPAPGDRWLAVVAALGAALPVVAVRPAGPVRPGDATRLAARLRESESVLLVVGEWPGAEATLGLDDPRWAGLGEGWGYLTSREVSVWATSKRYPRPKSVRVRLPGDNGTLVAAPRAADESAVRPRLRLAA